MYFYIAFDKTTNTEYLLYKDMIHKCNIYYSEPMSKCLVVPIGTFLLNFLNTDFEGTGIGHFIRKYCYKSIYFFKYSDKHHTIKKCKNCGKYFIPENLRDIKYCNNIFKDNKTCKQLGKDITYKNSLKNDNLLDMYRKRYISLASSVSHYGTEFENYKKYGAIMKKKYLSKEINKKDFEEWINSIKC